MHPDSFLAQRLGKNSKVLRNLESFSRSTGIPVRVINRGGREVWQSRPFKSKGGFSGSLPKSISQVSAAFPTRKPPRNPFAGEFPPSGIAVRRFYKLPPLSWTPIGWLATFWPTLL